MQSVAPKLELPPRRCARWVRLAQRDAGHWPGLTTSERERLKELEREVRELKRANDILGKASAYCAQAELDRRGRCWSASFRTIERSMGSSRSARCCRLPAPTRLASCPHSARATNGASVIKCW